VIPNANLPPGVSAGLRQLALVWKDSNHRPAVESLALQHWTDLIEGWIADETLPLLVRKTGMRGSVIAHKTGRDLVPVDNAPANWVLSSALAGKRPTLAEVIDDLEASRLPIAMMLKKAEREAARYLGTQRAKMDPPNLNTLGYKVCHIEPVGLGKLQLQTEPITTLAEHMRLFLSPKNMFVVPKTHAGLGELPEFLAAFSNA